VQQQNHEDEAPKVRMVSEVVEYRFALATDAGICIRWIKSGAFSWRSHVEFRGICAGIVFVLEIRHLQQLRYIYEVKVFPGMQRYTDTYLDTDSENRNQTSRRCLAKCTYP